MSVNGFFNTHFIRTFQRLLVMTKLTLNMFISARPLITSHLADKRVLAAVVGGAVKVEKRGYAQHFP